MKKLVLASAAALVLAGATVSTGTVSANSSRYIIPVGIKVGTHGNICA